MRVVIYWTPGFGDGMEESFASGLNRHGITPEMRFSAHYQPSELAVFWGLAHHKAVIQGQLANGADYLVMERGYIGDRFHWTSLGFNGLNGRAEFHNAGAPGDRWERHSHLLQPWRAAGDYALMLGQVPGDASLMGRDLVAEGWYATQALLAEKAWGVPAVFKEHPVARARQAPRPESLAQLGGLSMDDALAKAHAAVTFNSNAAVDAVLAGVPAVTADPGSMAWAVSSHAPAEPLWRGEREAWARRLAYAQWTRREIADGEAWAHLRRRYA